MINVYLNGRWRPVGGISVSSVVCHKTNGSIKDIWFTHAAQAIVFETDE
jgi:hypothetical protein